MIRHEPRILEQDRPRERFEVRDKDHNERARELLAEVGKFRLIRVEDLMYERYQGDVKAFWADVNQLEKRNLLEYRKVQLEPLPARPLQMVALTKYGRQFVEARDDSGQRYYAGFQEPRNWEHDASIYRAYLEEAQRIEESGGTPLKVRLDDELLGNYNRDLRLAGHEWKQEVAAKHGLSVANGRVVLPDLRIEYRDRSGHDYTLDVEVRSKGTASQRAAKHAAGFAIHSRTAGIRIHAPNSHLGGRSEGERRRGRSQHSIRG